MSDGQEHKCEREDCDFVLSGNNASRLCALHEGEPESPAQKAFAAGYNAGCEKAYTLELRARVQRASSTLLTALGYRVAEKPAPGEPWPWVDPVVGQPARIDEMAAMVVERATGFRERLARMVSHLDRAIGVAEEGDPIAEAAADLRREIEKGL